MRDNMKKFKTGKLARVTMYRVMFLAWALVTGICLSASIAIRRENLNVYEDFAKSYSRFIAENLNSEKTREYLTTGVPDEYYRNVSEMMKAMVDNADLRYLYVYVPEEQGIRYIWDAQSDDDSRPFGDIWYYEGDYPKEDIIKAYQTGGELFREYKYNDMSLAAYVVPMYDSTGNIVAMVEADIIMPRREMMLPGLLLHIIVTTLILMAVFMALFYYFTRKRIIRPLEKINNATLEIVENFDNDKEVEIDVKTDDEIEVVAHSIEKMNHKLKEYIRENNEITEEKARVNTELELAKNIQVDSLPREFPDRKEFNIYASMDTAREVGGDFYDFFFIDDNHLGMIMADVSGKGIPAAMFMMMSKSMLKTKMMSGLMPSDVLADVNNLIREKNHAKMFVTVWIGILDIASGKMITANAGHENPIIKKPAGTFEVYKDKHGLVLGGKKNMKYKETSFDMTPGTKLFVYTDGVPEARNESRAFYGMDNLLKALDNVKDEPTDVILAKVKEDIDDFVKDAEQFDDVTMMCIEYYGDSANNT